MFNPIWKTQFANKIPSNKIKFFITIYLVTFLLFWSSCRRNLKCVIIHRFSFLFLNIITHNYSYLLEKKIKIDLTHILSMSTTPSLKYIIFQNIYSKILIQWRILSVCLVVKSGGRVTIKLEDLHLHNPTKGGCRCEKTGTDFVMHCIRFFMCICWYFVLWNFFCIDFHFGDVGLVIFLFEFQGKVLEKFYSFPLLCWTGTLFFLCFSPIYY